MASRVTSTRFVGRRAELAVLEAAFRDAASGSPRVVLVTGDSGIGKTRLVGEALATARAEGARVLAGACLLVGEGELPYAPLVNALRPLAREQDPVLERLPATARTELARLVPALAPRGPVGAVASSTADRVRLFEAVLALVAELAADQPLVVVIEDVHWADASTRAFLSFLSRSVDRERLLTVVTYRSDELHRRHPLRPLVVELEREPHVTVVRLSPFGRPELAVLVGEVSGAPADEDVVRRLHVRSSGNPLWAEELLAAGEDGRGPLPSTLGDALMVRVEALGPAAQDVLRALAVGGRMDHELLSACTSLAPEQLSAALREAVAAQLVTSEANTHAFRHALLHEVVAEDLLPGEREALHLAIARALEMRGDSGMLASRIAHHHLAGGDRTAALAATVRAAEAAERMHAVEQSAVWLERALELWDQVPAPELVAGADRAELLVRAGEAHRQTGRRSRGETLVRAALDEVDERSDPGRAARLLERLSRAQRGLGRTSEALQTAQRALALVDGASASTERAILLAWTTKLRIVQGQYPDATADARRALEAADAAADAFARGRALEVLGIALVRAGRVAEGTAALEESIAIAEEAGELDEAAARWTNLADALHLRGRPREALAAARAGLARAADASPGAVSWLRLMEGEILFDLGDWEAAAATVPGTTQRLLGNDRLYAELRRAELALARGDRETADSSLSAAAASAATSGEPPFVATLGALTAELRARDGDLAGARAAVSDALDQLAGCGDDELALARVAVAGLRVEADIATRARDRGAGGDAEAAAERARSLVGRVEQAAPDGGPVADAWRSTARAELARAVGQERADLWRAAAAAWEAIERPHHAAAARLRQAEAHLAEDDRRGALDAAADALRFTVASGARWLEDEVRGLASRARLTLPGPGPEDAVAERADQEPDPFGLTPRERQVLELLADGASNRQIGEALFIAEKTASVHVSRILAKLGVRTRLQAAAVAHRAGLVGGRA